MKKIFLLLAVVFLFMVVNTASAQEAKIRASLKASVMQEIGADTDITIVYSRPGVKGRTIWGDLVPWGMAPGNKYSKDKAYPWRAGANENTTLEVTRDVFVNGKALPAGKYSIHMIPGQEKWVVIFNKENAAWGSYTYDDTKDALRVDVVPVKAPMTEWLTFGFEDLSDTAATAFLQWELLKVPFKISLTQ